MTVAAFPPYTYYWGDGVTTSFAYPFEVERPEDFVAYQDHVRVSNYTLTGLGEEHGGQVTFSTPPALGVSLLLLRWVALDQETMYPASSPFPAAAHEKTLDRLCMQVWQLQEQLDRASVLKQTIRPPWRQLLLPDPQPQTVLGWDAHGAQWTLYPWGRDGARPPDDPAWQLLLGAAVIGVGGCPAVAPGPLTQGPYEAFMPSGSYVATGLCPLSTPESDGPMYVALTAEPDLLPGGWEATDDPAVVYAHAPLPPVSPDMLLVSVLSWSGGACTAALDVAPHRVTAPATIPHSLTSGGPWYVLWPGAVGVASGATWTCNGPLLAPDQPGILPGPGTVTFGPAQASNAVWFCASGAGLMSDPWLSADGSGGFIQACGAVQSHGTLRPAPGCYRYTSLTPSQFDVPIGQPGVDQQGDLSIDLRGVHLLVHTTGTLFVLNKNGVTADTSTNLNTLHWQGGYFDTSTPGQVAPDSSGPIQGTAIDCSRTRNVSITGVKFRGLRVAINANVADTLLIQACMFRRCFRSVYCPEVGRPDVPQDISVENNMASLTQQGTELDGCVFVDLVSRTDNVQVRRNNVACDATNARFVRATSGGPNGASSNLQILGNTAEQYSTGSKLVELVRSGVENYLNVQILENAWASPLCPAGAPPPFANGQPYLDLGYVCGAVNICQNEFANTAVTAIKVEQIRGDASGGGGLLRIEGNRMPQLSTYGGKLFDITAAVGLGTRVDIGRNSTPPFYSGTMGTMVYPATLTRFVTTTTYTSNINAAASITISPWDNAVTVGGTTPVTTITPTWKGHTVELTLTSAAGRLTTDTGNLRLQGDIVARSTALPSKIVLACDGTLWTEISRFNQQLAESVAAAASVTINSFSSLVGFTGTGSVSTILGAKNGQLTVFRVPTGVTLVDSPPGAGNLRLPADIVGTANGTYIPLVFDSTQWNAVGPGQAA